jgi:pimeloyl-ACP methyl ester carboxylesterase
MPSTFSPEQQSLTPAEATSAEATSATETPTGAWSFLGHHVHRLSQSPPQPEGPALLLVHGFGASTDHWRHNIPVLSEHHEVHAIDLLGFGRSAKPAGLPYGGALWRDQLEAYVRTEIGRPTVLVGNSLGGYAALAAGAALGPQAAGVALINAAGPFADEQRPPTGWGAIARRSIGGALFRSPPLQRLLFENLRRPATVRRTLERVYLDRTNVDDALVESILRPSRDAGAFGVFALLGFNAKPSVNLPLICFAAAAWGAGLFLLVYKDSVRRRITRYVASELKGPWPRLYRWEIKARQLICTSAGLTYTYNLADLTGVHEDGRWLELSFGERTSCVLPLRAFADTEEKARFLATVGQPPARSTEG